MTTQNGRARAALSTTRASMLRMATSWQAMGQVNHAIDVYEQIAARFPGSSECHVAVAQLLAIAQDYERQGRYRLAMGLYGKLGRLA